MAKLRLNQTETFQILTKLIKFRLTKIVQPLVNADESTATSNVV